MTSELHDDCVKQRELDIFIENMNRWQDNQNGSIQRIEKSVKGVQETVTQIAISQQQFYLPFLSIVEKESDQREADSRDIKECLEAIRFRQDHTSDRVDRLERFAKIPGKWVAGLTAFVIIASAVVGILVGLRII